MGWASATPIFDDAVNLFLENSNTPDTVQVDRFVLGMYDTLTDADWDTVDESEFVELIEFALNRRGETLYENEEG